MKKFVLLSILFFSIKTFAQTNDGISHKKVYLNVNSKESGIILPDFRNFDVLMKMNSNSIVSTMNDYNYELGATDDINKSFLFTKKSVSFFWAQNGNKLLFSFPPEEKEIYEDLKKEIANAIDNRLINFENIELGVDENNNKVEKYWIKSVNQTLYIKLYENIAKEGLISNVLIVKKNNDSELGENKSVKKCSQFIYEAKLTNTLPQYRYLYSEKTYTDFSKRVVQLPEDAIVYVIKESNANDTFYYVCYNGISGYISENLLIK